jgi:hypothetical protein
MALFAATSSVEQAVSATDYRNHIDRTPAHANTESRRIITMTTKHLPKETQTAICEGGLGIYNKLPSDPPRGACRERRREQG